MHRTLFHGVACAATTVVSSGAVGAQTAQATFDRAAKVYRDAKTVQAQFDQTLTNTLLGTNATAHGELFRQRPNLFAIVFAKPLMDKIVCDGKAVWVYLPSSVQGQVIKTPLEKGSAETPLDPLGEMLSASPDRYAMASAGATTVDGHPTHMVSLTPQKSAINSSGFTKATLWIDDRDGVVRLFETEEASGVKRRVRIAKFVVDGSLPRSVFVFTPPAGVRVVER